MSILCSRQDAIKSAVLSIIRCETAYVSVTMVCLREKIISTHRRLFCRFAGIKFLSLGTALFSLFQEYFFQVLTKNNILLQHVNRNDRIC
ncbi:MAG: hypothetical protein D3904_12765 [Candidatus Electrothrix sp. EH2]|nr:hypothetical protein [Candidatus Electrothrix sp. EH2]